MRNSKFLPVLIMALCFFLNITAQSSLIPKFNIPYNNIVLTRPAQPHQYMDKIGSKAALMGFENGVFELWIWPWKVLRNFNLQFLIGTSTQPILSKDIVRDISVTPEATIITFVYESFTIKEIIFIPHNKTAAIILLDVTTTTPLTIVPGFMPVMQPQWPAGIGGQYSYWDDGMKAYVVSESQQRGLFLCGSPVAQQMAAPPAHMFSDNPIQFKIEINPGEAQHNFIPIVLAGSPVKTKYDSVKAQFKSILANVEKLYLENFDYYKNLKNNTLQIETPDDKLNVAFEFGKVALNNLLIENPTLGKVLVAGYGLSGGGGRAGFAWYFGGDAFINILALNGFGNYKTSRDALAFTQKWQRQDNFPIRKKNPTDKNIDIGKMAHELSQSDGLVDWWNDYHFGYNHADTTPWYLVAIGDYLRKAGDIDFIKSSWRSILQAYEWCKSKDSNGDALMDLKGAGLGVLEFGALVKIFNDNYTQSVWTKAISEMHYIAKILGEKQIEKETEVLLTKAIDALEKIYWIPDLGFYSFGAAEDGKQVRDKNIYSSTPIAFGLYDKQRSESTIEKFNESDMVTDWGVRNLSNKSTLYEPTNYNYGTIWPFTSYFIGTAQYATHYNLQGFKTLTSTAQHLFDYGLGIIPEVFSGDINTKLGEAYHNQGFAISGFVFPMVHGLLGLEVDAINMKVKFAPKLPTNWIFLKVKNIKVGENSLDLILNNENGKLELISKCIGDRKLQVEFEPDLPLGIEVISATHNGKPIQSKLVHHKQAEQLNITLDLEQNNSTIIQYSPTPAVYYILDESKIGTTNSGMKIISQEYKDKVLSLNVEGIPNKEYELGITNQQLVSEIKGAELGENKIIINIPGTGLDFVKSTIVIHVK